MELELLGGSDCGTGSNHNTLPLPSIASCDVFLVINKVERSLNICRCVWDSPEFEMEPYSAYYESSMAETHLIHFHMTDNINLERVELMDISVL